MLKPEENGGLTEVQYEDGNLMVSDTYIRYLMPIQVLRINERHKVTCGREICIFANILRTLLLLTHS